MAYPQLPKSAVPLGATGLIAASLLVTIGTLWAFERGAPDFTVFYTAWRLVLEGKGLEIYRQSPDRFLYAPGFAWLLAPLAYLPRSVALALWCFAKAAVVGYVVREFQPARKNASRGAALASVGLAAWGAVLLARPLLIDFQYGQVNLLILGACCWALLGRYRAGLGGPGDSARWFVLTLAAVAKIFPLPLLAVPWLARVGIADRRVRHERIGIFAGLAAILIVPAVSVGWGGAWQLLTEWRVALVSRGLPFESHNQSFSALLHRWLSGELVHIVALGYKPIHLADAMMSETEIGLLSLAWILISAGAALAWLMRAERMSPLRWIAVMVALLILPSHLVWKPYFVMLLPLGALIAGRRELWTRGWRVGALAAAFAFMNLAGFDLLGGYWGARIEAASSMLWAGLVYLGMGLL